LSVNWAREIFKRKFKSESRVQR